MVLTPQITASINIFWKSGVCKQHPVQYIITYVSSGGAEIVLESFLPVDYRQ